MKNGKRTKIKTYAKSEEEANAFKDSFNPNNNIVKSATLPTELCQQKSKNVEQEQNITTNNANNLMLVANKKNKVLSDVLPLLIQTYSYNTDGDKKTLKTVERTWRFLIEANGNIRLDFISPAHINKFKSYMKERNPKIKKEAIDVYLRFLKAYFNYLINEYKLLENNPVIGKIPKSQKGKRLSFSNEQQVALYNILKNNNPTIFNSFYISLHTGLRLNEVINLEWKNIDWEKGIVELYNKEEIEFKTKSRKPRTIVMDSNFKQFLLNLKNSDEGFVLGRKFHPDYVSHKFKHYCQKLNFHKDLTFHSIRHSFASNFIKYNQNIYVLKEILGHTSLETTNLYLEAGIEEQSRCVGNIKYAI